MKTYFTNYETMKTNLDTIKTFEFLYGDEHDIICGVISEIRGLCSCDDYIKFTREWSLGVKAGNYMTGLMNNDYIATLNDVMDGRTTFDEFAHMMLDDLEGGYELYEKYVKKYA